jgi:hypothetical protein
MAGPGDGAMSIVGRGFASQAGLDSAAAAVATSAKSSGEHETSLGSLTECESRGRVCESADTEKSVTATNVTKVRHTSLRNSI